MNESFKGRVAAITGAASGIGLECARALIDAGARVVLVDRDGDKLAQVCKALGPEALALTVDLLKPEGNSSMLPRILALAGGLHIFHANAGAYVGGDVVEVSPPYDTTGATAIAGAHVAYELISLYHWARTQR